MAPAPHPFSARSPVWPGAAADTRAGDARGCASGLSVERFELIPVAGDLAILRLLIGLDTALDMPTSASLRVSSPSRGERDFPARAGRLERRLATACGSSANGLLWRAAFGLPLALAGDPDATFDFREGAGRSLRLAAPRRRSVTGAPALGLASPRPAPRLTLGARQRLAAMATAVVVTTTSSPAVALADGATALPGPGASSTPAPASSPAASSAPAGAASTSPAVASTSPAGGAPASTAPPTTTPTSSATAPAVSSSSQPAASGSATVAATATAPVAPSPTPPVAGAPATAALPATPVTTSPGPAAPAQALTSSPASSGSGRRTGVRRLQTPGMPTEERVIAAAPARTHRSPLATDRPVRRLFATRGSRSAHRTSALRGCATVGTVRATIHPGALTGAPSSSPRKPTAAVGARLELADGRCATATRPGARAAGGGRGASGQTLGATLQILSARPGAAGPPRPADTGTPRARTTGRRHRVGAVHGRRAPGHRPRPLGPLTPLSNHPAIPAPGASSPATPVGTLTSSPAGFLAPVAWTGTVTPDPSLTGAVTDLSGLLANGNRPPSFLVPIYMQAGHRYGIPWPVLAAINAIESDYGRNLNTSSAGAIGWMQFEPSTWKRYGVAVDGHSVPNPYDPRDAIFSAARYLAAAGASRDLAGAIYAYNHAGWYVQEVLQRAAAIAQHAQYERATVRRGTFSVYFATGQRRRPTVAYRGGVLSHFDRLIAAANMVSAAQFAYLWGGGHEQPARFGPFDCSGTVSYVLQQAGYRVATSVSGDIGQWKFPTGPGRVTIFYNPTHTFMRIGNRFFGTSLSRPGGGAGWIDVNRLPADYLAQFAEVHVPRLGTDSFAAPRNPRAM
jgi:hypothetical protein